MSKRRTAGIVAGAGLGVAAAAALRRFWSRGDPGPDDTGDAPVGSAGAAFLEHLAEAVRISTVSYEDRSLIDQAAFVEFGRFLERTYPLVHAHLEREAVAEHSLLYAWHGSDPAAQPFLLLAHQDVVPVEPGTEDAWPYAAFSGDVADGFLWGRGAIDDKGSLIGILEAVESLLTGGFQPSCTVYLAFGHDEEIGGSAGAAAIAQTLADRGVALSFVLDEGGAVASEFFPGLDVPVALLGIAEKGYLNVRLSATGTGGHSSVPPPSTAIGKVAAAIARLEANPLPPRLEAQGPFFAALGAAMGGVKGRLLSNADRFRWLITRRMLASPQTAALVRTTAAVTMVSGGVKPNLLPQDASAVVNFRILPGETADLVLEHVRSVAGPEVSVSVLDGGFTSEPSPMSSTESPAFGDITATITEVFPGVATVPWVLMGATDSRYFAGVADNVYRFAPFTVTADDMSRIHGTGERIRAADADGAVAFFRSLITRVATA
ncbi:MAG: M20/M25/M40 family metallo-hydrolase [Acidimicrobiia bacterium]